MKKIIVLAFVIKIIFSQSGDFSTKDFVLDLNEIKRGMILKSNTRIGGNEMLYYNLKVLAVLKNEVAAKVSHVLAEIEHPYFEENGVLAGMSGSPVYLEGRLVGAIAYTFSFQKKPLVRITHIKDMLNITENSDAINNQAETTLKYNPNFTAIKMPLVINSKLDIDLAKIADLLNVEQRIIGISGSGGGEASADFKNSEIVPGDLVGVNLVKGDISISSYGTVTYKDKNTILAFGHAFSQLGESHLSLYKAYTDAVVPLQQVSFKVGSLVKEVGMIVEDRLSGILGVVGPKADYLPVKISLKTPRNDEEINFEVVRDKNYLAPITSSLVGSIFSRFEDNRSPLLVDLDLEIATDYFDKKIAIKDKSNFLNTGQGINYFYNLLNNVLFTLQENQIQEVHVKNISLNLEVENTLNYLFISEIENFKESYYPGEIVSIKVLFNQPRKKPLVETFEIKLPDNLLPGQYRINVSSEVDRFWNEIAFSQMKYNMNNLDEIFAFFEKQPANNKLNIWFFLKENSLRSGESVYNNLPFNKKKLLEKNFLNKKSIINNTYFQEKSLSSPVLGVGSIDIKVIDNIYD